MGGTCLPDLGTGQRLGSVTRYCCLGCCMLHHAVLPATGWAGDAVQSAHRKHMALRTAPEAAGHRAQRTAGSPLLPYPQVRGAHTPHASPGVCAVAGAPHAPGRATWAPAVPPPAPGPHSPQPLPLPLLLSLTAGT